MRVIKTPDGKSHSFPDDATDAEISEALNGPSPQPSQKDETPYSIPQALLTGAGKGVLNTVSGLGEMVHRGAEAVGIAQPSAGFDAARELAKPDNPAESFGRGVEQFGEFFAAPEATGSKLVMALKRAIQGGVTAGAQGASPGGSLATGAVNAIPMGDVLASTGRGVRKFGEKTVQSYLKPAMAGLGKISGASVEGVPAKAKNLVKFIIDNGLTSPDKARNITSTMEAQIQGQLAGSTAPVDGPDRVVRYMRAILKGASKQLRPGDDISTINGAIKEALDGPIGEDLTTMVPVEHPVLGPNGMVPQTSRVPRGDMTASEALQVARATSKHDLGKSAFGEMKAADLEASKAGNRALRDSVKAALPDTAPMFNRQANAIEATKVLDRATLREGNNNAVGLGSTVLSAAELASGKPPTIGAISAAFKAGKLHAGIWTAKLGTAATSGNARAVADILRKLSAAEMSRQSVSENQSEAEKLSDILKNSQDLITSQMVRHLASKMGRPYNQVAAATRIARKEEKG